MSTDTETLAEVLAAGLHEMTCEDNPAHVHWDRCATSGPCRDEGRRLAELTAARIVQAPTEAPNA